MTVLVSDTFDRADDASSLGVADTGQPWIAWFGQLGILAQEAYPTDPAHDSFTRPDSVSSLGTADTGQVWSLWAGTWGISNHEAYGPYVGGQEKVAVLSDRVQARTVSADITVSTSAQRTDSGLIIAGVDSSNFLEVIFVDTAAAGKALYLATTKSGAGALVAGPAAVVFSPGQVCRVTATFDGLTLTASFGAVSLSYGLTPAEQALFASGSYAGLRLHTDVSNDDGTTRFDNFAAIPIEENVAVVNAGIASEVIVDLIAATTAHNTDAGLVVAGVDSSNFLKALVVDDAVDAPGLFLTKTTTGGGAVILAGPLGIPALTPGSTYRVSATFDGVTFVITLGPSTLTYVLTGAEQAQFAAGVFAGLRIRTSAGVHDDGTSRFDNFQVIRLAPLWWHGGVHMGDQGLWNAGRVR